MKISESFEGENSSLRKAFDEAVSGDIIKKQILRKDCIKNNQFS